MSVVTLAQVRHLIEWKASRELDDKPDQWNRRYNVERTLFGKLFDTPLIRSQLLARPGTIYPRGGDLTLAAIAAEAGGTSLYAERNSDRVDHRELETGLAPTDAGPASRDHQMLRQEGGLNPPPRANSTPIFDRGEREAAARTDGVSEAKRACQIHWSNKAAAE